MSTADVASVVILSAMMGYAVVCTVAVARISRGDDPMVRAATIAACLVITLIMLIACIAVVVTS